MEPHEIFVVFFFCFCILVSLWVLIRFLSVRVQPVFLWFCYAFALVLLYMVVYSVLSKITISLGIAVYLFV